MAYSYNYHRRQTIEVAIGAVKIGGDNPVRIQSMASTDTNDTQGSLAQAIEIIDAGAEILRFTAQGVREAANLENICHGLRRRGYTTPLVADIHFNPRAAYEAACHVEKVRINPGNFIDPGRTFRKINYSDAEYQAELQRLDEKLTPFLEHLRANGTALRLGVNHGSLSDRIMSRYGDTPAGMVESAMEFLRVCRKRDFYDVVISIKASNVCVMTQTVRLLVDAMEKENMDFPLHLGVTEAGDGEDARIKSAVGIGSLLIDGIGDTIRVSLAEHPAREIPVAQMILSSVESRKEAQSIEVNDRVMDTQYSPTHSVGKIGGTQPAVVVAYSRDAEYSSHATPDFFLSESQYAWTLMDAEDILVDKELTIHPEGVIVLSSSHRNSSSHLLAACHVLRSRGVDNPVILRRHYSGSDAEQIKIDAAIDLGSVLLKGVGDGVMITADCFTPSESAQLAFSILQSVRRRISKTEYIACPGCGRTLFDLQSTLTQVKEATAELRGLKIGVMGCIVNGPGEMADADYGYVGASKGHVSLYKGKVCVEKNVPQECAVDHLVTLIKKEGDWKSHI